MIEDLEIYDWNSNGNETGESLKEKSISSYWLTDKLDQINWYESIKDLTFESKFYHEIPDILPYDKCMVRWENKSPKDSDYWGPVSNKEETERLFYTSLRCKSGTQGKIYCFRPWIKTYEEFRCFWNGTLKAVSGNETSILDSNIIRKIYSYLSSVAHRIPYHRCVFDICRVIENDELVFKIIEFNSWETNSGANHLDWIENTDILYDDTNSVYFVNKHDCITLPSFLYNSYTLPISTTDRIERVDPLNIIRGDYLFHNGFLYIHNDIWLGKFTLNLEPVTWKRGVYRFSNLKLVNNRIVIDNTMYDDDFRKIKSYKIKDSPLVYPRYGILIKYENKVIEITLSVDCNLCFRET